ncbi:hypothetical protein KSZ_25460 [Dictyobacter formicarum]|uniref:Uncharacterized protein n=1 Tax=Dictyobacter formicarum TaxID=2778368 RepID=A0ABQ3VFI1_9CHLR|nr:hypothetical protein KSZ_25460 [Dictyobacter formicarum]
MLEQEAQGNGSPSAGMWGEYAGSMICSLKISSVRLPPQAAKKGNWKISVYFGRTIA